MTRTFASLLLFCAICLCAPVAALATTIPTVPVGNLGNANDSTGFGGVSYDYRIGTTEVTNAQYVDFLNAKAASDPLRLYNALMGSNIRGGITQSGVSGGFTYATRADMANKPVNFVSWYDSIRFANWLNNGQGIGDTETGAYTLLGGTPTPSNGLSITREPGATWWLPSENEWYKAAYYQPAAQGGDSDDYWFFPTASNSAPTMATANSAGDIGNPGANIANINLGADWNGQNGNVTTVGSAGPLSQSFWGTSDQGGNVWEWNEALISGSFRGLRGGSFLNSASSLQSSERNFYNPSSVDFSFGFRVANVPGTPFPGDANGDDVVDFTDLGILLNSYNLAGTFATGDFNNSGTVDFTDLGILLNNYNLHAPALTPAAAVPEPSTLALAAIGVLGLLIAARRKR